MRCISTTLLLVISLAAAPLSSDTVRYTYDEAGRLVRVVYGTGEVLSYSYDTSGNVLRRELESGLIFADRFETGDTTGWSSAQP